jgi:hypothetical protein
MTYHRRSKNLLQRLSIVGFGASVMLWLATGCQPAFDTPGPVFRIVHVRGNPALVENSAAVTSVTQPGILFGINDSGHEPHLFALDTLGVDRGRWLITGAGNVDWEAAALGPCRPVDSSTTCIYIGDVGDNAAGRSSLTIYRVPEPRAAAPGSTGALPSERVDIRYPTGRHDVEAIYVSSNGDLFLLSKRPLRDAAGRLRPSLVFRLPAAAWGRTGPVTTELVDSLPIIPGQSEGRQVTDAALSADGRRLAVRTYREVFIIAVDPATGRLTRGALWWSCPVTALNERQGEGIGWLGDELLLTSEGRNAPLHILSCPTPSP